MEKHRTDETSNTKTRVDSCYLPRCLHSREIGEKQWLVNFQNIAKINCWKRFSLKKPLPHWVLSGVFSSKLSFEIPSLDHCKYALNWLSLKLFFNDHLGSSKKEKDREKVWQTSSPVPLGKCWLFYKVWCFCRGWMLTNSNKKEKTWQNRFANVGWSDKIGVFAEDGCWQSQSWRQRSSCCYLREWKVPVGIHHVFIIIIIITI